MKYSIIKIKNYKQACAYIREGVKPIDIDYIYGRMVFYFKAEDTTNVWNKWKNGEIQI
ncbi:hypothetical protein DSECCO2_266310 [anaerobic digester metagenome]